MKKLQWFHSNPTNITAAKIIAVNVLVLKVCRLKAIVVYWIIANLSVSRETCKAPIRVTKVEECDATDDDSSNAVGIINLFFKIKWVVFWRLIISIYFAVSCS